MELLTLERGPLELALCPGAGGTIGRFRHRGRDIMRPAGASLLDHGEPRDAACFPLVPFSGRIADARFRFQGRDYELARNFPPEPHAIHGQGWQLPWSVEHAAEQYVEISLEHAVTGTPLHYRAVQRFTLVEDGLEVAIAVTNRGDGPMPAGMGLHPYFPRTPGATLQTRLETMWLADERNIPRERVTLPETLDFSRAPRVAELELDNGFGGWNGKAILIWPELGERLTIEADPVFGNLVIFVPPGEAFFCVEPASHANNGFNLLEQGVEDTGVAVLAPGETLDGRVRFRLDIAA